MDARLKQLLEKVDVFIICPVRNASPEITKQIASYVADLETQGKKVHWPVRDTDQKNDPTGIRIFRQNRLAMLGADEIHIWWDPTSQGSAADIGALFMMLFFKRKKVALINKVEPTESKSMENFLLELSRYYSGSPA